MKKSHDDNVNEYFQIGGHSFRPGERRRVELPFARLATDTSTTIPMEIVHGVSKGPAIFLTGCVHGDEINGMEIIRQVLSKLDAKNLRGTVIAVPIVNIFGFIYQSRYLPDRRDLNRSFPGSTRGSLASRAANLLMTEVVTKCSYGIDLHTGANHRTNHPQIRANFDDPKTLRIARAFGAPVMINAVERDGSLRAAATAKGIKVLLYEAGEPLRFDQLSIQLGVDGIMRVMKQLKMTPDEQTKKVRRKSVELEKTKWVRAPKSGILRLEVSLGEMVEAKQKLGVISNAFGTSLKTISAPSAGILIGMTNNPMVHQGDSLVHIGLIDD